MTTPKKDTAPRVFRELALGRLIDNAELNAYLDNHADVGKHKAIPDAWLEAAAMEAYVAFTETLDTWVETLIAGRPPTKPLVEWEAEERLCPLCGDVSSDGSVHLSCAHEEQARADLMPIDDAKEIAQDGHRW